eukprot:scaffold70099_cov21-Prasinocladus_malaysianus.AAC.1
MPFASSRKITAALPSVQPHQGLQHQASPSKVSRSNFVIQPQLTDDYTGHILKYFFFIQMLRWTVIGPFRQQTSGMLDMKRQLALDGAWQRHVISGYPHMHHLHVLLLERLAMTTATALATSACKGPPDG